MEYYNPSDLTADDLVKRIRIGTKTREFVRTPTGSAILERALFEYRTGIEELQKIAIEGRVGSSEEELKQYRKISSSLATPLKVLQWLNGVIADGDNAEAMSRYREDAEN